MLAFVKDPPRGSSGASAPSWFQWMPIANSSPTPASIEPSCCRRPTDGELNEAVIVALITSPIAPPATSPRADTAALLSTLTSHQMDHTSMAVRLRPNRHAVSPPSKLESDLVRPVVRLRLRVGLPEAGLSEDGCPASCRFERCVLSSDPLQWSYIVITHSAPDAKPHAHR